MKTIKSKTEARQGLVPPKFQAIIERGFAGHEDLYRDVYRMFHLVRCKIHEEAVRGPKYWANFESPVDKAEGAMQDAFERGVDKGRPRFGPAGNKRWLAEYLRLFGERYNGHEDQIFDPWTNRKPRRWYPKKREKAVKKQLPSRCRRAS